MRWDTEKEAIEIIVAKTRKPVKENDAMFIDAIHEDFTNQMSKVLRNLREGLVPLPFAESISNYTL